MDADDRKLFEDALRQVTQAHAGGRLDPALDELGWADAYADEPQLAVALLFEQQGLVNATSDALAEVVCVAAGVARKPATAVALPPLGHDTAPGVITGDTVAVDGLTSGPALGDELVVVARSAAGHVAVSVARSALDVRPVAGMDPTLELVQVSTTRPVPVQEADTSPADWPAAVAAARVAIAHELVGSSRAMLRLARDHAVDRIQFGVPIASFQAVRHRLSDSVVAIESAAATVTAAWETPSAAASTFAKAVAGRSARIVARHAQQVLAGMGFTLEHPFHRHLRRSLVLDDLFGGAHALTAQIGREALRTGRLPDLVPL